MSDKVSLELLRRQLEQARKSSAGDGGGPMDTLEPRVARLEDGLAELKGDVKGIGKDVSYIKGRLDSMPTTIQLLGFVIAIFVAAGVARYFGH